MQDKVLLQLLDDVASGGPKTNVDERALADEAVASITDPTKRDQLAAELARALVYLQIARGLGDGQRAVTRVFDIAGKITRVMWDEDKQPIGVTNDQ